jgi:putative DNA primase/helicase
MTTGDVTKINVTELGDTLLDRNSYIMINGQLYVYRNGVYQPNAEPFLYEEIKALAGKRWSLNLRNSAARYLMDSVNLGDNVRLDSKVINMHPGKANVANEMLDLDTLELTPHDPRYRSFVQLAAAWMPDADTSFAEQCINDVFEENDGRVLLEFLGSAFIVDRHVPKNFVVITGEGDSGKSKVVRWFIEILGVLNVSTIPLQKLADERFAKHGLLGKMANISGDLSYTPSKDAALIKELTGEDYVYADIKNKTPIYFLNTARMIFSANTMPPIGGADTALYDRLIELRAKPNRFTADNPKTDPNIIDKLTTPENLAAGLKLMVQGYQRFRDNGFRLSHSGGVVVARREYEAVNDSVMAYLLADSVKDEDEPPTCKDYVYLCYRAWCKEIGRSPVNENAFTKRMMSFIRRSKEESSGESNIGLGEAYSTLHIPSSWKPTMQGKQVHCYTGRKFAHRYFDVVANERAHG